MVQSQTVNILLVEDDDVDAEMLQRAFRKQRIANPITVAQDGIKALSILRGTDGHEPLQRPFLVLLDLNMPRMNGLEFLEELRKDDRLKTSVVFVLTTSDSDRDILAAYENQVAGYIVKSQFSRDFLDVINMFDHYWRVIEFPPA